jgi:hypothetical protein
MLVKSLAILLLACSAYLAWWALANSSPLWLLGSAAAFVCSFGLFRKARWAQYLWHAMAGACSAAWVLSVVRVALSGWPHDSWLRSVVSLVPGIVLLVVLAGGSVAVAKHYRPTQNAP